MSTLTEYDEKLKAGEKAVIERADAVISRTLRVPPKPVKPAKDDKPRDVFDVLRDINRAEMRIEEHRLGMASATEDLAKLKKEREEFVAKVGKSK